MTVALIVAAAEDDAIGYQGSIPWYISQDLKRFRRLTMGHAVIVGAATHQSILDRLGQPLPGRQTIVVSHHLPQGGAENVNVARSIDKALAEAEAYRGSHGQSRFFIAGGASIYEQLVPVATSVHLTRVHGTFPADRFMPKNWLDDFQLVHQESQDTQDGADFSFLDYERAS